ncbi:MAG TPA: AraC family transcriptional regulator [Sphaerochaetaceae bacterium]|jgi:AraC-like DNA-binding protein|nr:AraC family transcriptional regulator [Sphaerochaetaceae bacterium]
MEIQDAVFVYQMKNPKELRWHGRTHAHGEREFEIHYFLGGDGEFVNGKTSYTISPGALFVSAPKTVHSIHARADDPVTYYAILIDVGEGDEALGFMLRDQERQSPFHIGTNYRFFFEEVKEKGLSQSMKRRQSACHQMCSLLYMLEEGPDGIGNDNESRHLERALRIMQKNVMGSLTLGELADELNLTESYFIRLFSRRMRQTPMKYYMKLKVEAASALLTCTELSVKEISAKLGFSSEFHFSKQFKLKTGMAPTYYRRNYLQMLGSGAELSDMIKRQ